MSQANDLQLPRVTDGMFIPAGESRGRVHLHVRGENFVARAVPLLARLGEQMVNRVVLRPDGRGFAGILERMPRRGDRLFVGYADTELQATDVVYQGDGPDPAIA